MEGMLIKSCLMNMLHLMGIFCGTCLLGAKYRAFGGEDAKRAFDELEYEEAIRFYDGYANHIEKVCVINKVSAKSVDKDKASDVYIVAKDFSWTYVRTHEEGVCGPYFCRL